MNRDDIDARRDEEFARVSTSLDEHLVLVHRCGCGCRFQWPERCARFEGHTETGEIEEVYELAQCPRCRSSRSRVLAEPWPRAYFAQERQDETWSLGARNGDLPEGITPREEGEIA
jgi:hypothetical protein